MQHGTFWGGVSLFCCFCFHCSCFQCSELLFVCLSELCSLAGDMLGERGDQAPLSMEAHRRVTGAGKRKGLNPVKQVLLTILMLFCS